MQFKVEDIEKLLETADSETIAQSFTSTLNEAIRNKKAKEAEVKKNKIMKFNDTKNLITLGYEYIRKYYPEAGADLPPLKTSDIESIIDIIDKTYAEYFPKYQEVKRQFEAETDNITKFLKEYGLM